MDTSENIVQTTDAETPKPPTIVQEKNASPQKTISSLVASAKPPVTPPPQPPQQQQASSGNILSSTINTPIQDAAATAAAMEQKRRSSSRSIKRKRFDDEIVEYSLGIPPAQLNRIGRARTQSQTFATATAAAISASTTTTTTTPTFIEPTGNSPASGQPLSPAGIITTTTVISAATTPPSTTVTATSTTGGTTLNVQQSTMVSSPTQQLSTSTIGVGGGGGLINTQSLSPATNFTSISNNSQQSMIPPAILLQQSASPVSAPTPTTSTTASLQATPIAPPEKKQRIPKSSGATATSGGGGGGNSSIGNTLAGQSLGTIHHNSNKKSKKQRGTNQISTKDLGRWKPIDDLSLIIGIQQTNDLRMVHRGTKFSCKFTVQEMQSRWYSLLYEEPISRIAVAAMRNLHPEIVESVHSKALYTQQEEEVLGTIKSSENPTIELFQELLDKNAMIFYPARTAKHLISHWQLMKQYSLLPDQIIQPPVPSQQQTTNYQLLNSSNVNNDQQQQQMVTTFSDAEDKLNDQELMDSKDDTVDIEQSLADRINKKEIRQLENELTRWTVLVDSLTDVGFTPEFDNQTLAVLRGRLVRYLMRSREITFGRMTKYQSVDVDLSLEGPAHKVSRKQGTIKIRSNGDFFVANEGQRPVYIDGMPLMPGSKSRLNNNCVLEISGLRFIFLINSELIKAIRQESAKMNGFIC